MNKNVFIILVLVCSFIIPRSYSQSLGSQVHAFSQVYDSVYGIQLYDKFNPMLGGDSARKYSDGHLCNNLIEDHYPDGKILHKGFYTDGYLTDYTNYYPDGTKERVFKPTSDRKSELKKYYPDKKLKSDVKFYKGNSTLWQDYYENGQVSYLEEYDNNHKKLLRRCSWYINGKPQSLFMPSDSDKHKMQYISREYYPNGQLEEVFQMFYNPDSYDFIKEGDDKLYDEKGNLTAEYIYVGGRLSNTIK